MPEQVDTALIDKLTDKTPNSGAGGINLDTPITYNGKAYTVADLLKAKEERDAAAQELNRAKEEAKQLKERITTVYGRSPNTDPEKWKMAVKQNLLDAGFSESEADAEIATLMKTATPPRKNANGGRPSAGDDEGVEENPEIRTLKQDSMGQTELMKQMVNRNMTEALDTEIKNNTLFTKIIAAIKTRDGEEEAKKAEAQFREDLTEAQRKGLREKFTSVGGNLASFKLDWIPEISKGVVDKFVDKARRLMGDPDSIGRSPYGSNGEDQLLSVLNAKAPPPPKYQEKGSLDGPSLDQQVADHMNYKLARAVAEVVKGDRSVV